MNPSYETIAAQSGHYPFVEVYQFLGADVYQFTGAGDTGSFLKMVRGGLIVAGTLMSTLSMM
jgi:hypothetical protein